MDASTDRSLRLLTLCQGLLLTQSAMLTSVNGLAGLLLAPDPRLATLPVTVYVLGGALATLPISLAMQRHGRRYGFALGCAAALLGALVAASGIAYGSFLALCAGTLLCGVYNASGQYFRFAVFDLAPPERRARALGLVLSGGLLGAVLGPFLSRHTIAALDTRFLGTYLVLLLLASAVFGLTRLLALPAPEPVVAMPAGGGARFGPLARRPGFWLALLASAAAWASMNLLMTATPLAMQLCGYPFADAAFALQWHMVGMYAPMLVAGRLLARFGERRMIAGGALIVMLCNAVAWHGESVAHFELALALLGVGWALLFSGGTALLVQQHGPADKGLAQGVHDTVMFGAMTVSSLMAGVMVARASWAWLQGVAFALMLLVLAGLALLNARAPDARRAPEPVPD